MTESVTTPILETQRLLLRPVVFDDHKWVQQLFSQWEVARYMSSAAIPWPYPADGAEQFFTQKVMPRVAEGTSLIWTIVDKADSAPIGIINLRPAEREGTNRGFWLDATRHGRGYMSEIVHKTTDYAFGPLAMPHMRLNNAKENTASAKLKINAGAVLLREEEHDFIAGRLTAQWWEVTPERWAASPLKLKFG